MQNVYTYVHIGTIRLQGGNGGEEPGAARRGLLFQHSPSSREETETAREVFDFNGRERFRKRVGEHFVCWAIDNLD